MSTSRNAMMRLFVVAAVPFAAAGTGSAKDAFDAVQCGGDVAKALIGNKIGDEPVATIEKRHAAIGLKDEGGDEISESLFYESWTLCGASYHLLVRRHVVRDVVRAEHSTSAPSFVGSCTVEGSQTPYSVLAILDAHPGGEALPAKTAWRIDETNAKFIAIDAKGMTCPRVGIDTADEAR
jgi:hypothetical protein